MHSYTHTLTQALSSPVVMVFTRSMNKCHEKFQRQMLLRSTSPSERSKVSYDITNFTMLWELTPSFLPLYAWPLRLPLLFLPPCLSLFFSLSLPLFLSRYPCLSFSPIILASLPLPLSLPPFSILSAAILVSEPRPVVLLGALEVDIRRHLVENGSNEYIKFSYCKRGTYDV